jgi:hypothetical protein
MADPNLTESAWQRALSAARRVYPSTEFEVAAALMTIIAGAIAAVASADKDTTIHIAIPILGGAVALLMTFAVVLAFQLVAAPIRQRNELRAAWTVPEIETVNVDLTLRNAHRRGNELAQLLEAREGIARGHREEIDAWTEEVVALLAAHLPNSAGQQFIAAGQNQNGPVRRLRLRVNALQQIVNDNLG